MEPKDRPISILDVKVSFTKVTAYHGGEVVAEHKGLRGRRGQHDAYDEHMHEPYAALSNPWSRESFEKWGTATARRLVPPSSASWDATPWHGSPSPRTGDVMNSADESFGVWRLSGGTAASSSGHSPGS